MVNCLSFPSQQYVFCTALALLPMRAISLDDYGLFDARNIAHVAVTEDERGCGTCRERGRHLSFVFLWDLVAGTAGHDIQLHLHCLLVAVTARNSIIVAHDMCLAVGGVSV